MKKALVVFTICLILCVCSLLPSASIDLERDARSGELYSRAMEFGEISERANLQMKVDKAVDVLIKVSIGELRKRGAESLAGSIEMDWNSRYKGFVMRFKPGVRDLGDHEAILWLLKIHDDIEFVLGAALCKTLRLHDLWTIAYTVPVVFSCIDKVDQAEYGKHFIPLSGIASFWGSYIGCSVATMETGVVFLCNLIGMGVEELVKRFVAPGLVKGAHKAACS